MMRVASFLLGLGLGMIGDVASWAQEPPKPDPIEISIAQQWQAAQTGQQNVADALGKLLEAYRKEKARADAAEAKVNKPAEAK